MAESHGHRDDCHQSWLGGIWNHGHRDDQPSGMAGRHQEPRSSQENRGMEVITFAELYCIRHLTKPVPRRRVGNLNINHVRDL